MTREEEIKCASKDYINYLLDKQEYHNENYTEYDIQQAFEKGAMFVNNNLGISSLWHDASEEPKIGSNILVINKIGRWWNIRSHDDDFDCDWPGIKDWICCVRTYDIQKWAYIEDILPKKLIMTREKEIDVAATHYDYGYSADSRLSAYCCFRDGAEWADSNPKSPWISVEDDLPCNHKKLISTHINLDYEKETVLVFTATSKGIIDTDYMVYDNYDGWFWKYGLPKYWMPMPKLPKEGE